MAGRLVDRVAPVHRADQATHSLTRRDRRHFFEGTAHLMSTRVCLRSLWRLQQMRWSRPAKVLCDGGPRRSGGCASEATWTTRPYAARAVKKTSASGALMAVDCVEELAIFIRGAALPMDNFPCIIIAVW